MATGRFYSNYKISKSSAYAYYEARWSRVRAHAQDYMTQNATFASSVEAVSNAQISGMGSIIGNIVAKRLNIRA